MRVLPVLSSFTDRGIIFLATHARATRPWRTAFHEGGVCLRSKGVLDQWRVGAEDDVQARWARRPMPETARTSRVPLFPAGTTRALDESYPGRAMPRAMQPPFTDETLPRQRKEFLS